MKVEIKTLPHYLHMEPPEYATEGSAAVDLRVAIPEQVMLLPGETVKFPTGLAMHINDPGVGAFILPRSGLGTKGLILANTVGLIDSDYQGEMFLPLYNRTLKPLAITPNMRVAQMVFMPVIQATFSVVPKFDETTARGEDGFGSSGEH